MANPLTQHLHDVGESYGHHWMNATRFGLRMVSAGSLCCLHAFLPFLFRDSASTAVKSLHREMDARRRASDFDWVI